jgi:hypothetical protein
MSESAADQVATYWAAHDDPNQDTIVLLQEEIARLEGEIRSRDEAMAHSPADTFGPEDAGPASHSEALKRQVEDLVGELAAREEMIALLLEQTRFFEDAAAAQRAEWEQLHQWVEEVERRVEGRDAGDGRLRDELAAEQSRSESLRRAAEVDRRTCETQRRGLESEAGQLRGQLERRSQGIDGEDETAFIALASENRRLRTAAATHERVAAEAAEFARRLTAANAALEQARADLRTLEDERQREKIEHEAELTASRSQSARESIQRQGPTPPGANLAAVKPAVLEADERIRAFRQHLKELHDHEAEQRADRTLSGRLSRLWRHTSPG